MVGRTLAAARLILTSVLGSKKFPISNPPLGSNKHDGSLYSLLLEESFYCYLLLSSIALYYEQLATKKNPLYKRSLRLNRSSILRL